MYEAKEAGRNRFALYRPSPGTPPRLSSRLAEAERIRRALAHDQLELYCQPILDLVSNEISQYELLVRLRTDDGELLPPSAFLYVAERFGSILSIDSWVVQQAVALIASHARAGRRLTLNVNVSAKSIGSPQLVAIIDRALADAHIDPACLVFELTETAAIGNIEQAKTFTTELRSRGCRFALDDFGSGFGSFYYLKHLPFDYFKIDGDFICGFGANTTDQLVVEAIVGIARGMGKKTVAEFVTDRGHAGSPAPTAASTTRRASTSACPSRSPRPFHRRRAPDARHLVIGWHNPESTRQGHATAVPSAQYRNEPAGAAPHR